MQGARRPGDGRVTDPTVYRRQGVKISTEFAEPGRCYEHRPLHSYISSLDWIIPHLRAMGEGLENPGIELIAEGFGDDPDCQLYVVGLRDMTEEEKAAQAGSAECRRAEELAELARLRAAYERPEACPHCHATEAVPLSSGLGCTNDWHDLSLWA